MYKYLFLIFLIACTPVVEEQIAPLEVEEPEEIVEEVEPEEVIEEPDDALFPEEIVVPVEVVEEIIVKEQSITEQYEQEYNENIKILGYRIMEDIGELWVFEEVGKQTTYIPIDYLFEVKNKKVSFFDYGWRWDYYNIKNQDILLMNMIVTDAQGTRGCFVEKKIHTLDNCVRYNGTLDEKKNHVLGEFIIQEGFTFNPSNSPRKWLKTFHGRKPLEIRENRMLLVDGVVGQQPVHELFFSYKGDVAKLSVHTKYKVPIRVDILESLEDKTVKKSIVFTSIAFNELAVKKNKDDYEVIWWF